MKPVLFILDMPFEVNGKTWFCSHCALIEGALKVNPHWESKIDLKRVGHAKPRKEVIEVLDEERQWLPVLVLGEDRTITDPVEITAYLAEKYGGAAPHP